MVHLFAGPVDGLLAGIKMLFGRDPKKDYKDKVAHVDLTDGRPG